MFFMQPLSQQRFRYSFEHASQPERRLRPARRASDVDGHRARLEPPNRLNEPGRPVGFPSKPTHKLAHFHIGEAKKAVFSNSYHYP